MLHHIHIRHFAIVDELALEFGTGMTVLTGETGAGKSILLDALGLALGDRAESGIIRAGADRAEVSAEFDIAPLTNVQHWLSEHELDDDGQCLIRRTVSTEGRSKGYINGRPVPMQSLRELGEQLVDIHGQHAHQSLLKRDVQRQVLDDLASNANKAHQTLLSDTAEHFRHWQRLTQTLAQLHASKTQREDRLELLRYQVEELQLLALSDESLAELEAEHSRLANLNQLREGVEQIQASLDGDSQYSISSGLDHASSELARLGRLDADLANACEALQGAAIQASEASNELRNYLDGLSMDPERLQVVDERIGLIHDLARKHHCSPKALPALQVSLEDELQALEQADVQLGTVSEAVSAAQAQYHAVARKLSASRQKAAKQLAGKVTANLHQLGMPHGQFEIALEATETPGINGLERVEFRVSANPGQPVQPMAKVASGGELARISLAVQVIAAGTGRIPTLIFDEVDVGIGGGIAEVVGRLLRNLSADRQVLCVTHQPQVASLAHHHLQVSKQVSKQASKQKGKTHTVTDVSAITKQNRVAEIARMLGGLEITEQTLSHAREMIERGQQESGQR
ncbi:MAG: DNA repair protein RecN [Gammaproteobacteria bacterium]|nr:DNA repair protein RecN [Gammaproteobacteria bacterium]